MKPGRIACINAKCKRTADAAKFPDEMICAKCFRALPVELRTEHRFRWRQYNLYSKRALRTADVLKCRRLLDIADMWGHKIVANWLAIKAHVLAPEKPEGLDNFLDDMGMK